MEAGRRILVAVDESEESMYALSWCLDNLVSTNNTPISSLFLLYVKPPPPAYSSLDVTGYLFGGDVIGSMEKYWKDVVNSVMDRAETICRNFQIQTNTLIHNSGIRADPSSAKMTKKHTIEEVAEAQSKTNEEFHQFQIDIRNEFAALSAKQTNEFTALSARQTQNSEELTNMKSQLESILNILNGKQHGDPKWFSEEAPISQFNSKSDEPTLESVVDQLHVLEDDSEVPVLEDIVSPESSIKHSIVAENEQVEEIVDNGGGLLPFTDLESVVSLEGEGIAIKHELKSFSIHESVEKGLEVGKLWAGELEQQSPLTLEGPGAAHNLFDKNPSSPLKEHNEGSHRSDDCVRLFHCMPLVMDLGVVGTEACYVFEEMSHYSAGVVKAQRDRIILNSLCLFKKGDIIALSDVDDMDTGSEAMGVKDVCDSPFLDIIKGLYGLWANNASNRVCLFRIHAIELETYECKYVISFNDIDEMFYFDPGGCSFFQMDSAPFEFNGEKGENGLTLDVILLIDNDVAFYFDPGGYTVSQMDCESFILFREQGGLSLSFDLAPDVIDALVKEICYGLWFREAYGYGDMIEYSRTREFVGEVLAHNALMAWSSIDRDCEGRKIGLVILRKVLDILIVIPSIPSKNVCVWVVDGCPYLACGLALQFMFDMLLVFFPIQISVSSANYHLTNSAIDDKLRKLVFQVSGYCIFLEHVKRIHRALEIDNVALVWSVLCNGTRVEEIIGLFCDTLRVDGNFSHEYLHCSLEGLFMGSVIDPFEGKQRFTNSYFPYLLKFMVILGTPNAYISHLDRLMIRYGLALALDEMLNHWIMKMRPFTLEITYGVDEDSECDVAAYFLFLKLERHQWGNLYVFIFRRLGRAFFSRFRRTLGYLVWKELPTNTISTPLLCFLTKATALNMSYCPDQTGSTWKWLEYWPLFHFWMLRVPLIAVVDVKYVLVPPCPASGYFTVLIPYMLLSFQDIRLGNIVSFGATISIESQLEKHFMETIMIAGDDWTLKMEYEWSILQKVICNEDALLRLALYDYDGLKLLEYSIVAFCLDHLKHEKYQVVQP